MLSRFKNRGPVRTGPLALWEPVADCRGGSVDTRDCEYCQSWGVTEAVARRGRSVSAGREGKDDLVVEVWRAVRPKRLIGSLNRDTGVSPWGKVPMLRTGMIPAGLFADPQVLSNGLKKEASADWP